MASDDVRMDSAFVWVYYPTMGWLRQGILERDLTDGACRPALCLKCKKCKMKFGRWGNLGKVEGEGLQLQRSHAFEQSGKGRETVYSHGQVL